MQINHELTENLVCPYCGKEHFDSWDIPADTGSFECEKCEREFHFEKEEIIRWNTKKID